MSAAQQNLISRVRVVKRSRSQHTLALHGSGLAERKLRVYLAAGNRLLLEALSRVLTKPGTIEVIGQHSCFDIDALIASQAEVLLLASRGDLQEDLTILQRVRSSASDVRILLLGMARDEDEFLQCVGAGVSGFLLREASSAEVLAGVRAVHAGEAVCPGALCGVLFRYFRQALSSEPFEASARPLGLSRREGELLPLIGEGLTNAEIAIRLGLSEQTVKNHLHRMKRKVGAKDRLELVQRCYARGFLVKRSGSDS